MSKGDFHLEVAWRGLEVADATRLQTEEIGEKLVETEPRTVCAGTVIEL